MPTALKHFVTRYDSGIKFEEWAIRMFGDNKCIVAAEKMNANGHVHFHGYTDMNEGDWAKAYEKFNAQHPVKIAAKAIGQGVNPTRKMKNPTELGFQYVCKEDHHLFVQGITQEEIDAYRTASNEHVKKMKNGGKEHCHEKHYEGEPAEVYLKIARNLYDYNLANDLQNRPQAKRDAMHVMMSHPECTPAWHTFLFMKMYAL